MLLEYPPNTSVDLRQVVEQLDIPKRRIYDITNVIEGIELGLKKGHNMFQWTGTQEELLTLAKGNRQLNKTKNQLPVESLDRCDLEWVANYDEKEFTAVERDLESELDLVLKEQQETE